MNFPTLFVPTHEVHEKETLIPQDQQIFEAFEFLFNEEYWHAMITIETGTITSIQKRPGKGTTGFYYEKSDFQELKQTLPEGKLASTRRLLLNFLQLGKLILTIQSEETRPFAALVRNKNRFYFPEIFPLRLDLTVLNTIEALGLLEILIENIQVIANISDEFTAFQVAEDIMSSYEDFFITNHKKSLNFWLMNLAEDVLSAINEFAFGAIASPEGTLAFKTAELFKKFMSVGVYHEENIRGVDMFLRSIVPLYHIAKRASDPNLRVYLKWYLGETYCDQLRVLGDVKVPNDFNAEKTWKELVFLEEHVDSSIRKLFSELRFILSRRRINGLINGLRIKLDFVGDILRVQDILQIISISFENLRSLRLLG